MERFLRYNQICDEKLPLVEIRKNKPKSEISLSQLLITRDIQNLHLDICFGGWKCDEISLNFFAYHQRRQNPRWPTIMVKKLFSVLGERRKTRIQKFNSHPYTLSLPCLSYSKFSQLSYEPGCSRELWCRECATCLRNKYVLIFSKSLFYTHIQRYTAVGTKCHKTM